MSSPSRVVVTGGLGYVGSTLVGQLVQEGNCEVHIIDNLASGERRLAMVDLTKVKLHHVDIRDAAKIRTLLRDLRPGVIFHLAAVHYIPACEAAPGDAAGINIAGTVNLLDAAVDRPRFVFASSAAVYRPDDCAHTEAAEHVGPIDIYGLTKLHAERYVEYFHRRGAVDGAIVRLFNVVGPGETNPHLVPAIIGQIARGERRVRLGNLFPQRDYIDVRDAAEGFRRLAAVAARENSDGPIVSNLGTGRSYAVREVVEKIGASANVELEIVQDADRVRANDRPRLCASTQMLKAVTGWSPTINIADSMLAAWNSRKADGFA